MPKKKPTQREIGFDNAVFLCAAYLLRMEGWGIAETVKAMIAEMGANPMHGSIRDLETIHQFTTKQPE